MTLRPCFVSILVFLLLGCDRYTAPTESPRLVSRVGTSPIRDPVGSAAGQGPSGESPAPTAGPFDDDDYAAHIEQLKKRLPTDQDFFVVVSKPFVVVGHGSEDQVRRWAEGTVQWAVERLKALYFSADPAEIIDIWLFNDKESYERYNRELFGAAPSTPFGYYSAEQRALVMNIATGGGTLVHEIVHPFIGANFKNCPAWFNEGLASLYEQSSESDGQIVGLTNWRLAGLQTAIQDKSLPTFDELCHTTTAEFYSGGGVHYAQARYLCYYLQEQGQLQEFYRQFVATSDQDPSGYDTLLRVLGNPDVTEFEQSWRRFVLRLRFP